MRAAIYTRISRDRTGEAQGVERQRDECLKLAERLGWTNPAQYSDNDISAYSGVRRPQYERMLADVEAGKVDAIIAWHTDRLHRRPIELERFIDLCDKHEVEIRTVQGGDLDLSTASGRMVARMLGAAARHEVEHMSERQQAASRQAALSGKYRGGPRPFGYESDGVTVRPAEARAVEQACRDALAGKSMSAIAREWNAAEIRTTRGNKWQQHTVRQVLTRDRNAGFILVDGQRVAAAWDAIVDVELLDAVRYLCASRPGRQRKHPGRERKTMGSGVFLCGKCGERMVTGANTKQQRVYRCRYGMHLVRLIEGVDKLVGDVVVARLSAPDAQIRLDDGAGVDVDELRARRAALSARLDESASMFADGTLTASQLKVATEQLRAELEAVELEITEAQRVSPIANLTLSEDGVREAWEALKPDIQGKIVDELMTVTILPAGRGRQPGGSYFSPESVRIEWKV